MSEGGNLPKDLECRTQLSFGETGPFGKRLIIKKTLSPGSGRNPEKPIKISPTKIALNPIICIPELLNEHSAEMKISMSRHDATPRFVDQHKELKIQNQSEAFRLDSEAGGGGQGQDFESSNPSNRLNTKTGRNGLNQGSVGQNNNRMVQKNQLNPKKSPQLARVSGGESQGSNWPKRADSIKTGLNNVMKGIVGFGKAGIDTIMGGEASLFKRTNTNKGESTQKEKKAKESNRKLEELKKKNEMLYKNEAFLTFSANFKDYFLFWLPNWISGSYPKKELFSQGMEMIRSKLEVGSIITGMNELEKLKSLLFDQNQYYLFQNIQKPFLIGFDVSLDAEEDEEAQKSTETEENQEEIRESGIISEKRELQREAEVEIAGEAQTVKIKQKTMVSSTTNFKRRGTKRRKVTMKIDKKTKKKRKKKKKKTSSVLLSNQSFWNKDDNVQKNFENFQKALDLIKGKGDDQNVIDKRLLSYFNGIFGC